MEVAKSREQSGGDNKPSAWDSLKDIPFAGAVKDKYEQGQRSTVEQVKQSLASGEKTTFEVERQTFGYDRDLRRLDTTGLGRAKQLIATSKLWRHINPKGYEKALNLRKAEATKTALDEYRSERAAASEAQRLQRAEEEARRKAEYEQQRAEWEEEQARYRKEAEDRQFLEVTDVLAYNHHENIVGTKVQELAERALSDKLTSVEEIAAYAEAGEGASLETLEYEGRTIPVYHVDQLPIKFLQTTINYKEANRGTSFGEHGIGFQSMENLVENPSFWDNDASVTAGFESKSNDERLANTISMSYVDEEFSSYGAVDFMRPDEEPPISYAFTKVQPDSLIHMSEHDVASSQSMGELRPKNHNFFTTNPDNLIINGRNGYNELVMRRYDPSTGKLLYRPDFIRTKNGLISEAMLKHAAYFNVPIVDINQAKLDKAREAHLLDELSNIDENSDYTDILRSAKLIYKHTSARIPHEYGNETSKESRSYLQQFGQLHPEMIRVLELEHTKVLDYAEEQLRLATKSLQNGEQRHDALSDDPRIDPPENYHDHTAQLSFVVGGRGGTTDYQEITIKDGANTPSELRKDGVTYDSVAYNRLKPLAEAFLLAKNHH